MDARDWQRVNEIVVEALELAPEQRSAFLDEQCRDAPSVRREAESLLAAEGDAANFLDSPAVENYATFFESSEREEAEALLGQKVGNYRIIGELGHGGMGAVYLAERSDGKFEQRVALKLLKREMNTTALRKHFEQERKILAALQHPNIARLLDAGATRDRVPFLVMEYVEGLPIDDYCSCKDLTLDERLDLFRKVCAAVDFAHRNLIIHRDLKPSNILVKKDGTPVLLDFGISKILSEKLEDTDSRTITRMGVMTPQYASPEQLKNESVTTATDVYSLGVILYELLAGRRPFQAQETNMTDIFRAVIEHDPPAPSTVAVEVSGMAAARGDEADTAAQRGRHTVPQIRAVRAQQLRGDLDNIALKALKKEPERRYSSVEKLGDDIERYQRGLPVSARSDTFTYRAQKFVGRNRSAVIAAAFVLVALLGGLVATLWQASVAARERDQAQLERDKAEQLNAFLQSILSAASPEEKGKDARVIEVLDDAAERLDRELGSQPELKAKALTTIGKTYETLGLSAKAEPKLREALTIYEALNAYDNQGKLSTMIYLAEALVSLYRFDEAEPLALAVVDAERRLGPAVQKELSFALFLLGELRVREARYDEAEVFLNESIALCDGLGSQAEYDCAFYRISLGRAKQFSGSLDAAESIFRQSLTAFGSHPERHALRIAIVSNNLGDVLITKGNYAEGLKVLKDADVTFQNKTGDSVFLVVSQFYIARAYLEQQENEPARVSATRAVDIARKLNWTENRNYVGALRVLGLSLTRLGRANDGEAYLREAMERGNKYLRPDDARIFEIASSLGECLTNRGRFAEAEELLTQAFARQGAALSPTAKALGETRQRLVKLYSLLRRPDEAAKYK
jgi:eukaryotic-like serine/threonine-protein kinase